MNPNGTELIYDVNGTYVMDVNGTNTTYPEYASIDPHPSQCLSSVISYNVPTQILSIDYEHLLEYAKVHIVKHPDTNENETDIDKDDF